MIFFFCGYFILCSNATPSIHYVVMQTKTKTFTQVVQNINPNKEIKNGLRDSWTSAW